jgi:hypothetical protein
MKDDSTRIVIKAFVIGITMPLLAIPVGRHLPDWATWAIVGTVMTLLFHWVPPRVLVTPAKSVAISIAAGAAAAVAVLAVNHLR